jgi:hypothetical protein
MGFAVRFLPNILPAAAGRSFGAGGSEDYPREGVSPKATSEADGGRIGTTGGSVYPALERRE